MRDPEQIAADLETEATRIAQMRWRPESVALCREAAEALRVRALRAVFFKHLDEAEAERDALLTVVRDLRAWTTKVVVETNPINESYYALPDRVRQQIEQP